MQQLHKITRDWLKDYSLTSENIKVSRFAKELDQTLWCQILKIQILSPQKASNWEPD